MEEKEQVSQPASRRCREPHVHFASRMGCAETLRAERAATTRAKENFILVQVCIEGVGEEKGRKLLLRGERWR